MRYLSFWNCFSRSRETYRQSFPILNIKDIEDFRLFKFVEKMVFVTFLWSIYLLFRYYKYLNFLGRQSLSSGQSKELVVCSAQRQYLVLLSPSSISETEEVEVPKFLKHLLQDENKIQTKFALLDIKNTLDISHFKWFLQRTTF